MLKIVFISLHLIPLFQIGTCIEQCRDIVAPLRFFKGSPMSDASLKELSSFFEGLFKSLGSAFQNIGKNSTATENPDLSSLFNIMNPSKLNESLKLALNETIKKEEPVSDQKLVGTTQAPKSASFDLGKFLSNIIPQNLMPLRSNETNDTSMNIPKSAGPMGSLHSFFPKNPNAIVQPAAVVNMNINIDGESDNKTDSQHWGVTIPMNAVRLHIVKLNNSHVVDAFSMDDKDPGFQTLARLDKKKFVRHVTLTNYNVTADLYYAVCVDLSTSRNDVTSQCRHCALLRACETIQCNQERVVAFQAPGSKVQPNKAELHYLVYETPLPNTSLITRVVPRYLDNRCPRKPHTLAKPLDQSNGKSSASSTDQDQVTPFDKAERSDRLYDNSMLYVEMDQLSPYLAYAVQADLLIQLPDEPTRDQQGKVLFEGKEKILMKNYIGGPLEFLIGACHMPQIIMPN